MNKYQEALRTIGNTGTKFVKRDRIGEPKIMYLVKQLKRKEYALIKELVDKETPKPIIVKTYMSACHDIYGDYLRTKELCSNCKKEIDYSTYKYCPHCGQKLDWGE